MRDIFPITTFLRLRNILAEEPQIRCELYSHLFNEGQTS